MSVFMFVPRMFNWRVLQTIVQTKIILICMVIPLSFQLSLIIEGFLLTVMCVFLNDRYNIGVLPSKHNADALKVCERITVSSFFR
jgi:hypothetical protein